MTSVVTAPQTAEVFYPSSDGEPLAETSVHVDAMINAVVALRQYLAGQQAIVLADQFLYYAQGYPKLRVAPDVMVILNVPPGPRDNYKTWEEGQLPVVIFEITSESTKDQDQAYKKTLCQQPHPQGDGACDSNSHFWADHNRRIDCRPELKKILTNVYRSVVIRMALIPTLLAPKFSLRRAIPSLDMSTLAAFLRGVARVNKTHIHTSSFSFVSDECLKLVAAPAMQSATLSLPHLGSTANVGEVFKNQCCTRLDRLNQTLTQHMVTVFPETSLSARQPF